MVFNVFKVKALAEKKMVPEWNHSFSRPEGRTK